MSCFDAGPPAQIMGFNGIARIKAALGNHWCLIQSYRTQGSVGTVGNRELRAYRHTKGVAHPESTERRLHEPKPLSFVPRQPNAKSFSYSPYSGIHWG
ncbi:MAG: hypothetical protein M1294_03680 [Firmicutes bacterium]|nr:hypothetical protein [Bacillota bacterium]